ncbi:NifX-associated nitrogen fixation protein [Telmatospirillum sp.]|uniref:NifX-associated nitrogen fixation protein n=1 Tax=Telmatospirillum sp. TaxID=2079197 RepID=UPI00283C3BED|nr:NifX-associated nitrogen fixation protein [Telmatospirillum sp.]MDR3437080.1 NifX-associated nitrogen fixation protein [Telmatospirillum sp.]
MSDLSPPAAAADQQAAATALQSPFLKSLVSLVRAQDRFGIWEKRDEAELLADFIVDREQRKLIPIIGDPDPDVLSRVEWFYGAVGLQVESRTGIMASPIMQMSHEGFGRMVVTAGRLVVINKHLRDLHRFGFLSLGALAEEGAKVVDDAVSWIEKYPDVAGE